MLPKQFSPDNNVFESIKQKSHFLIKSFCFISDPPFGGSNILSPRLPPGVRAFY